MADEFILTDEFIELTLKLLKKMTSAELLEIFDLAGRLADDGIDPVEGLRAAMSAA